MNGLCIAFNPCCKCDEKGKCNICELTYRRNGLLVHHADVAPVRHGEWLYTNSELAEMTCSLCGFTYYGEHDIECMSAFCPECGAKMDVERRSENEG